MDRPSPSISISRVKKKPSSSISEMTVSPFDHPLLSGLLGDETVAQQFSAEADIAAMMAFEAALAEAEAEEGAVPDAAAKAIVAVTRSFRPDIESLRRA